MNARNRQRTRFFTPRPIKLALTPSSRRLLAGMLLAGLLLPVTDASLAQGPPSTSSTPSTSSAPSTDALTERESTAGMSAMTRTGDSELPADAIAADPTAIIEAFKDAVDDAEIRAQGLAAVDLFDKKSDELKESLVEMRRLYLVYANGNPEKRRKKAYLDVRTRSRELMNETYDAALDVFRFMPHPVAMRFLVTSLLYRTERSVYDDGTREASARLLDYGSRLRYVAISAARSGVVSNDFVLARRLYEKLEPKELEDVDRRMFALLDQIEKQYEIESKLRETQGELPKARFKTTRGEFTAELYINEAPSTVAHFINLVESGFYDGLDFFQVVNDMLALTGDPIGDGTSTPDRFIADEHERETIRMPLRGSLVMAKLPIAGTQDFVPNSGGTQFAILFMPLPSVTTQQTVFGRVIDGMHVLGELRRVDLNKKKKKDELVLPPDRIESVEILNRPKDLPPVNYVEA
ncbi:MAG: peptidylprolyl isomerase, partial [Planctomycetota bacterium]